MQMLAVTQTQTLNVALNTGGMISLLAGVLLPILVGFVTKKSMNAGLKAAVLASFSGLAGVLGQWITALNTNTHFAWQAAVLSALITWAVGEGAYYKLWKPSGIAAAVQAAGPIADVPVLVPPTMPTLKILSPVSTAAPVNEPVDSVYASGFIDPHRDPDLGARGF